MDKYNRLLHYRVQDVAISPRDKQWEQVGGRRRCAATQKPPVTLGRSRERLVECSWVKKLGACAIRFVSLYESLQLDKINKTRRELYLLFPVKQNKRKLRKNVEEEKPWQWRWDWKKILASGRVQKTQTCWNSKITKRRVRWLRAMNR